MKNRLHYYILSICLLAGTLFSCSRGTPILSLGIDDVYHLPRMQSYRFTPGFRGEAYRWSIKTANGQDSLVSTEQYFTFVQAEEGSYDLKFEIIDPLYPFKHDFRVEVVHEYVEYSPYLSRVFEFRPAPGQFVNEMPKYDIGDTEESMRRKAEQCISGTNDEMISLGGYGGYLTFGFDHTVVNVKGKKDFAVYANAFYSLIEGSSQGGSCEPGIVMVAFDKNKNGKADDDEWFELAGSEYYKPETIKNYEITYNRPDPNKKPTPDASGNLTDTTYVPWTDNLGASGYIEKLVFHKQDYYPKWIKDDQMTFKGTKLQNNGEDISGMGAYWVLHAYDWGYVDNHPNDSISLISFDIDWAVDKAGNKVHLPGVDFIKVYTGVNQQCGWIGETSTEIIRARDLHIYVANDPKVNLKNKKKEYLVENKVNIKRY